MRIANIQGKLGTDFEVKFPCCEHTRIRYMQGKLSADFAAKFLSTNMSIS